MTHRQYLWSYNQSKVYRDIRLPRFLASLVTITSKWNQLSYQQMNGQRICGTYIQCNFIQFKEKLKA